MWDLVINAVVSVCSMGGGVIFMRSRSRAEVAKLQAEVEQLKTNTREAEIKLLANASQTLINNIVKPLENELNKVRRVVNGLQKAIQKLYDCPSVADCPVRKQLQRDEENNGVHN
jgi:uncharacterized membrane protein